MRALTETLTETAASQLVDEINLLEIPSPTEVHPYRAWIWLGVFAAGAAFWFGVGLGIHALVH